LKTLMKRGLQEHDFLQLTTAEVRNSMARAFQRSDPWELGIALGLFAKTFGARAPLDWVSHQLFYDCVWTKILDDDVVRLKYAHGYTETVDSRFFCDLDDGIDTSLYEWWLSDIDFFLDYKEFEEWRDVTEDSIAWDMIEFGEAWHDTIGEYSEEEKALYDKAKDQLSARCANKRAAIDAEAVRIGL
jgi:hypothetical protein